VLYTPPLGYNGPDSFTFTANDGFIDSNTATVTITVNAAVTSSSVEVRIAGSSDDAEQLPSGRMSLPDSDLEMTLEDSANQTVGLRFNHLDIPPGAIITNAYIQFQADETHSGSTSLMVWGEAIDNAPTFNKTKRNISSRTKTATGVSWSPPSWSTAGASGPDQRTPDISSVIQQIVNRPGWASGNSLVIIITGSGERVAESYDGMPAAAPLLHVEYTSGPSAN